MTTLFIPDRFRLITAAMLLVALAACGSDGEAVSEAPSVSDTSSPAVATEASEAADAAPVDAATQELQDRFVAVVSADPGPLDAAAIACISATASSRLPAAAFELLVTNLETINEIEDGNQFTDDELWAIATSFADCGDLTDLVGEAASEYENPAFVSCITDDLGQDRFEASILADLLGENAPGRGSVVLLAGLDGSCATEARAVVDRSIIDQFSSEEQAPIVECLPTIDDAELRPFVADAALFPMVEFVRQRCA